MGNSPVPAVVTELTTLRAARKGIRGDGRGIVGIMARDRPCHAERNEEAVDGEEAGGVAAAAVEAGVGAEGGVEGVEGVAIETGNGTGAVEGGDTVAVVVVVVVVVVFEVVVVEEVEGET